MFYSPLVYYTFRASTTAGEMNDDLVLEEQKFKGTWAPTHQLPLKEKSTLAFCLRSKLNMPLILLLCFCMTKCCVYCCMRSVHCYCVAWEQMSFLLFIRNYVKHDKRKIKPSTCPLIGVFLPQGQSGHGIICQISKTRIQACLLLVALIFMSAFSFSAAANEIWPWWRVV